VGVSGALEAVLFDAAGTLIETHEPVGTTYAHFARRQGVQLPADRMHDAFRRVLRNAPPMPVPRDGSPDPRPEREWWRDVVRATIRAADASARFRDFDAYFDALFEHFAQPGAWSVCPGAREALAALRARGLRLAVVSNFDRRLLGILDGLELGGEFETIVIPGLAGAAKPDPRIFEVALLRLDVPARRAVYVGDDPDQDVRAARAAGLRSVDVASLDSLADLPEHLEALAAGGGA
jgi:putative hydrolase of the HAD superfamily